MVVLHDLVLQHLFLGLSVERGNTALYVSEMKRAYGDRGAAVGRQIAAALGSELLTSKFPLCERLVERSYGVLVLTRFMQRWLEQRFGAMPGGKVHRQSASPLFAAPAASGLDSTRGSADPRDFPENEFLVASFGLVTPGEAHGTSALLGFRRFPSATFATPAFWWWVRFQESYPLGELAVARDWATGSSSPAGSPMDRFYLYMLACDVVVNLRFPSTGELSGTLIRTLGMGKPVLVSNTGPFVEFPEHTVARIDLGPPEVPEIARVLLWLARNPRLREAMGRFAREHVEAQYKLSDESSAYAAFLRKVVEARRRGSFELPRRTTRPISPRPSRRESPTCLSGEPSASSTSERRLPTRRLTRRSAGFSPASSARQSTPRRAR